MDGWGHCSRGTCTVNLMDELREGQRPERSRGGGIRRPATCQAAAWSIRAQAGEADRQATQAPEMVTRTVVGFLFFDARPAFSLSTMGNNNKKNSVHLPPPPAYPIQDVLYSVHTCDRLPSPWLAELSIFNPTHLLCLRKRGWILNSNLELLGITNRMNNLLEQPQTLTLHIFGID